MNGKIAKLNYIVQDNIIFNNLEEPIFSAENLRFRIKFFKAEILDFNSEK